MNDKTYNLLENYMQAEMGDSAHDKEHVYRVLYTALQLAKTESGVDYDVLIAACLLHDVGRKEQFANPSLCHAEVGGDKAYGFLVEKGFAPEFAERVKRCIVTHRFRKNNPPQSIEAKLLFDADKIDTVGALGIARSLQYSGMMNEPLYTKKPDGTVSDGTNDSESSFFGEYKFKLVNVYSRFYTESGRQLALSRQSASEDFYNALLAECSAPYLDGRNELNKHIDKN